MDANFCTIVVSILLTLPHVHFLLTCSRGRNAQKKQNTKIDIVHDGAISPLAADESDIKLRTQVALNLGSSKIGLGRTRWPSISIPSVGGNRFGKNRFGNCRSR